jgi:hypothetical protein
MRFLGAVCRLAHKTTDIGFSDFVRHAEDTNMVERFGNDILFTDKTAGETDERRNILDCGRLSRANALGLIKCDPQCGETIFQLLTLVLATPNLLQHIVAESIRLRSTRRQPPATTLRPPTLPGRAITGRRQTAGV